MSATVHSWATPDPDEYSSTDPEDIATKWVCTFKRPWPRAHAPGIQGPLGHNIEHVFHPHMTIEGVDYVCTVCGERTNR